MLRKSLRAALFSTAALAGVASAERAAAQASADEGTTVSEIIVTTQRRSERLRDVPISIVAKTGDQLDRAGIKNIEDIAALVPSVKIDQIGNYLQPAIRGVSSTLSGPGTEQPVAIYVDGFIQPDPLAGYTDFVDLDRIEVTKGPQGTLFGRNATGGAISMFTKTPSATPTGQFEVGYGNYKNITAKGYVSGPIAGDVLAGSFSAYYEKHDGYDYDIFRKKRTKGENAKVFRGKLQYTPNDSVKITFIGQYQDRFDSDAGTGISLNGNNIAARLDPGAIIATQPHTISVNSPSFIDVKAWQAIVIGNFKIGDFGSLNITSGYHDIDSHLIYDGTRAYTLHLPSSPFYATISYPQPDKYYSNEVTFASNKFGGFSFVVGGYQFHQDLRFEPLRFASNPTNPLSDFMYNSKSLAKSYAGFGEVTYEITDKLTVIGGMRYTRETRQSTGTFGNGAFPPKGYSIIISPLTFHAWTPRFSIKYKVNDDTNVYFTYSQGFKSGGSATFTGTPSYKPEKIKAYEVGLKSSPMSNLSVDLAGYYYKYTDLQVQIQKTLTERAIVNAATAEIYGVDGNITWRPTSEFTLNGGLSLLHAKYQSFNFASVLLPCATLPATDPALSQCNAFPYGNANAVRDASGKRMTRAPNYSFVLSGDYHKDIGPGTIGANVTFAYSGSLFYDSINRIRQKPYEMVNARMSFEPAGKNIRFEVWGKNLTNSDYIGSVLVQTTGDAVGYGPPRTYGATVSYRF